MHVVSSLKSEFSNRRPLSTERAVAHLTRSLARDSIFFIRTVSSKRGLTWAGWDSSMGIHRGVVGLIGYLYVLFLMRRFVFGNGSVGQKLMHFCPPGILFLLRRRWACAYLLR